MNGVARVAGRRVIAYHEAGHAVVGHRAGLTFGTIHLGDVGGQVLFDAQWGAERVVRDPDPLDRHGLMLLASAYVEQRCVGAESDVPPGCRPDGPTPAGPLAVLLGLPHRAWAGSR
jgi:hypothetical protein